MERASAGEALLFSNFVKTYVCVSLAGLIFIWAVLFDMPLYALIGVLLDWLPLPTGWMKFSEKAPRKKLLALHVALTLVAYVFYALWLLDVGPMYTKILFLEVWWLAVMSGVFTTFDQLKAPLRRGG